MKDHQSFKRWKCLNNAYISVELPDKAREIVVLEVSGEKTRCKDLGIPNDETVAPYTPRNNMVCCGIVDEVIGFG